MCVPTHVVASATCGTVEPLVSHIAVCYCQARRAEEERLRKEEEERLAAEEEERRKLEEKERKKAAQKAKKEELKRQGKLLTGRLAS